MSMGIEALERAPHAAIAAVQALARGTPHAGFLVTLAEVSGRCRETTMGRLIETYRDAISQPVYTTDGRGRLSPTGERSPGVAGLGDVRSAFGTGNAVRTLYFDVAALAALYTRGRRTNKATDLLAAVRTHRERDAARLQRQKERRLVGQAKDRGWER